MPAEDDDLVAAMADAAEGGGVVFFTDAKDVTTIECQRAQALVRRQLISARRAARADVERLFQDVSDPWLVRFRAGGYVLFLPVRTAAERRSTTLTGGHSLPPPELVYWQSSKGDYQRVPFATWQALDSLKRPADLTPPEKPKPKPAPVKKGPLTAWDLIDEGDE